MIYNTPKESLNSFSKQQLLYKLKKGSKNINMLLAIEDLLKTKHNMTDTEIQNYLN